MNNIGSSFGNTQTSILKKKYLLRVPCRTMQFQISHFWWQERFHRIPQNCLCHRNWATASSVEIHGTTGVIKIGKCKVPWNSTKFYSIYSCIFSMALMVPWNSIHPMSFFVCFTCLCSNINIYIVPQGVPVLFITYQTVCTIPFQRSLDIILTRQCDNSDNVR